MFEGWVGTGILFDVVISIWIYEELRKILIALRDILRELRRK